MAAPRENMVQLLMDPDYDFIIHESCQIQDKKFSSIEKKSKH